MANTKISAMTTAGTLTGAELVPLVQSSANVQTDLDALSSFARGHYGAFQDFNNQAATLAATPYVVTFGTTQFSNGITLASGSRITVPHDGIYHLSFSVQLENSVATETNAAIWVKVSGTNVAGSSRLLSLPAYIDANNPGHVEASWDYFIQMTSGQYIEIWWQAGNTGVSLKTYASNANRPAAASVIANVTQVN
jgi:hypothetical protein